MSFSLPAVELSVDHQQSLLGDLGAALCAILACTALHGALDGIAHAVHDRYVHTVIH